MTHKRLPGIGKVSVTARLAAVDAFFPDGSYTQKKHRVPVPDEALYPYESSSSACPIGYVLVLDRDNPRLKTEHRLKMIRVPGTYLVADVLGYPGESDLDSEIRYRFGEFMNAADQMSLTRDDIAVAFGIKTEMKRKGMLRR